MRVHPALRAERRSPLLQVLKSALAVIASWLLASLLLPTGQPPIFACIGALFVVQPSLNQSLTRALERSIGVVAGVLVATALTLLLGNAAWVVLLALALALVLAWALRLTPGATTQVGITVILVMTLGSATPEYAVDRIWETLLGVSVGFILNLAIVPPVLVRPAAEAVHRLTSETAASLDRLGAALVNVPALSGRTELLLNARLMRPMQERAQAAIRAGRDSLTLNPRARSHRRDLDELQSKLDQVVLVSNRTIAMTRSVADLASSALSSNPEVDAIVEQLRRSAHDVRLLGKVEHADAAGNEPAELPALTAPLRVVAPSQNDWILIGSLIVDVGRIHAALTQTED